MCIWSVRRQKGLSVYLKQQPVRPFCLRADDIYILVQLRLKCMYSYTIFFPWKSQVKWAVSLQLMITDGHFYHPCGVCVGMYGLTSSFSHYTVILIGEERKQQRKPILFSWMSDRIRIIKLSSNYLTPLTICLTIAL